MAITMDELANILGVSRGTVDRALNGRSGISERTKKRVLDAAREHGYVPHYVASSLATGRSQAVGILVFDLLNRHFSQMVNAAESRLMSLGIFSYVCITEKDKLREKSLIGDLAARRVDGILLLPINQGDEISDYLRQLSMPIVTVSNRLAGFPFVGGDGSSAVYRGMRHFLARGYETVHFVCPPLRNEGRENMYAQLDRAQGYRAFRSDHPAVSGELIATADYLEKVEALIRSPGRQGFFCSSDHYALKILRHAHRLGLEAPRDFALMGFDGVDILDCLERRPTTVFYPAHDIGERAAEMLYELIQGREQPMEQLLDCPLLPGETV